MARKQYRWTGEAAWQSQAGNALLALINPTGSGKKLLVHTLEVHPRSRTSGTGYTTLALNYATVDGGRPITLSPRDTQASLPSGIEVRKFTASDPASYKMLLRKVWMKNFAQASTQIGQSWGTNLRIRNIREGWFECVDPDSDATSAKIRPGEAITLTVEAATGGQLLQVSGVLIVEGSPNRTYHFNTVTWAVSEANDPISIVNNSASSVVRLKRLTIAEIGTLDTPFLRVIPVGAVDPQSQADTLAQLTPVPMDSAYGALNAAHAKLVANAPLLPWNVPAVYAADVGAGAPRGMSYLHTKDFDGPQFTVMFPEHNGIGNPGVAADNRGGAANQRTRNLLSPGAPIVVREGEAIAVVGSAETAAAAAAATGTAGWSLIDFGIQFSVEPTVIPSITVTGVVAGSDVVILDAGTSTVLASGDAISGTTFAWEYDADLVDTVDICVYKQGYVPLTLRGLDPGNAGITIPVAQVADRNFVS
jgi:hypothetical protein